ncbi:ribonuclease H-like domain-containing protein [Rhizophagus clarus]|uniref:Ribonuclease H-like domain-containing protein n=1 Tax=Rhizophagus clarus TaxID=94130 RepID=A0A8H3QW07_9GLOM|nr:ribonuclease H-like domain-containing protein [Rhizophagus clarus]
MSTQEFTFSNPSPDTTPIIPTNKKRKTGGGRPKSLGSPQDLEAHFANDCSKVPADTRQFFLNRLATKAEENTTNLSTKKRKLNDGSTQKKITEFHESSQISEDRSHEINRACVKAFVVCGIAWHVIENPFFVEFLKTLCPGYTPPSKDLLSGKLLSQETAVVNARVIKELKNAADLTLSCDGWTNSANESIWNFLIHTSNHREYLWCLKDLSNTSHTGEFLAEIIEEIIDKFGPAKFSAIVTDSGANIRNARQIITEKYKNILNVRCMAHAINLISKDICSTSFANQILTKCNTIITYFKKSHQGGSALKEAAKVCDVSGGGLKKWADTRWHTMYDCVDSIIRHKVPLENLKRENPVILSTAVLTVLRSRAFFDDVRALAFTLRPIKQLIAESESQSCTLADCFLGLAKLGAAIKKLPNNDHRTFRQQCISIFNRRYAEFADLIYLLCFFLHPSYTEICWARGTFRNLLMIADEVFMKMGKNNTERKELMHQMKKYRKREEPFDIKMGATETPCTWWFSIKDSFPKDEDYLVQLALKLFSITPHAAGCERVWSSFGWLYGKRRTRLSLDKIENMYKLSAYYHANAKKELPYYGIEKSTEEIHQILVDAHLNLDQDLLELEDDLLNYYDNEEEIIIEEEEELNIGKILNLDAFVGTLGDIIEDSIDSIEEGAQDNNRVDIPTDENENHDIEWDPAAEADEIVNTIYNNSSSSNSSTTHNDRIVEGDPVTLEMEPSDQDQDPNILVAHHSNTTLIISLSLNRELDIFLQRARIIFNNNNSDSIDHSINFINLKFGFHNINGTNLQHYINTSFDNCSYEIRGSLKHTTKHKESGVALLIHSKWQRFHFSTVIFLPFLMTLRLFEQTMNNITSDPNIIHIWIGDMNCHFDYDLDVNPPISNKKEDIPLCFNHLNLIDSFRFLNPELKEFF